MKILSTVSTEEDIIGKKSLFTDPLLRAAADPVTANMVKLGPDLAVAASTLPMTRESLLDLVSLAIAGGDMGDRAWKLLGTKGLPTLTPSTASAVEGKDAAAAILPPDMWEGLLNVGEYRAPEWNAWPTDTVRIEWEGMARPIDLSSNAYHRMFEIPGTFEMGFGTALHSTNEGSGLCWVFQWNADQFWYSPIIEDVVAAPYTIHSGVFTLNATTGAVTLTINDVVIDVEDVAPFAGFTEPPAVVNPVTDPQPLLGQRAWLMRYFRMGPDDASDRTLEMDSTNSPAGTSEFDGWRNQGGHVMTAPTAPKIVQRDSPGNAVITDHDLIDLPATGGWTFASHMKRRGPGVSFGMVLAAGWPIFSGGSTPGWQLFDDVQAPDGQTQTGGMADIHWILTVTDGNQGGNPFAWPGISSTNPLPTDAFDFVMRWDADAGFMSVWIDGTKAGEVDISALGAIVPDDATGTAPGFTTGLNANVEQDYLAIWKRALADDEIAFLSATPEPSNFNGGTIFAGLFDTPAATTTDSGLDETAVNALIATAIDDLINGAPGALDTLNELATALGDDANFASTVTTALAGKQASSSILTSIVNNGAPGTTGLALLLAATATSARSTLGQAWTTIADVSLSGISTKDITLTGYRAIRFRFRGGSTTTGTNTSLRLTFNSDSGNNYSSNTTVTSTLILGNVPGTQTNTDRIRQVLGEFTLSDGTTWTVGEVRLVGANASTDTAPAMANPVNCVYLSSSTITVMTLSVVAGNFTAASRLFVEGLV